MRDSEIKKHNYFRSFVNLKSFESLCFSRESKEIKNFSKLLPLKDQLMSLDFYEDDEMDKKAPDYPIGQFTSLETLNWVMKFLQKREDLL
jgi:hypothetical protein